MKPVVLLIIPNLGRGGAQKVFRHHLEFYSRQFEVVGCVFNMDGAFEEDRDARIVSLDVPAGSNWLTKVVYFRRRVAKLRELKKARKVALSISHLEGADYVNVLSSVGERKMLWIHGTKSFDGQISGVVGWLRRNVLLPRLYRRADKIACVSEGIADELKSNFGLPAHLIKVILNGVDIDAISKLAQEPPALNLDADSATFVIATHGRLAQQKNISFLVALAHALKDVKTIKWLIVGDGEARDHLLQECIALGLRTHSPWKASQSIDNAQVIFTGQTRNPFSYLKACDLYMMTSLWEGFPLAICEALAIGLPVMAADCPTGPSEILVPGGDSSKACGLLMPALRSGDNRMTSAWRDSLLSLIADKQRLKEYSIRGKARAADFSVARLDAQLAQLTTEVLTT